MVRIAVAFLALVSGLGGAGYWNYQRNAGLDRDLENRPYRTLSTGDLQLLEQAYRDELTGYTQKLDVHRRAAASGHSGSYAPSDLQGKIEGFGRAQARAGQMREVNLEKLEREVGIEQIAHELTIREAGLDQPWNRIKRRLLTF
jgi:hypothetical protein